jgi:nicotinate-nucleotide pyrophosphorylase (carboxylating)
MTEQEAIRQALIEDIGNGDHSSLACIDSSIIGQMQLIAKQSGILAGIDVALMVLNEVDSSIRLDSYKQDGDEIKKGDIVFTLTGPVKSMLTAERTVLNFLQRMSGIATATRRYIKKIEGTGTTILDTRKTTPNMRIFEKYAVKVGGGTNHRFGLYDMIMLKDNHIDFAGGIEKAIDKTHQYLKDHNLDLKIEIETRNIEEVKRVVAHGGVDRIMLDNFTPEKIIEALQIIDSKYETEASGGITLDNLADYAKTGVNLFLLEI